MIYEAGRRHQHLRQRRPQARLLTNRNAPLACRDPKDDKFLELAINGSAEIIISGDADLLVLNPFRGIPIVTAAAFIASRPA